MATDTLPPDEALRAFLRDLRRAIWAMQRWEDIRTVFGILREGLQQSGIPATNISLGLIRAELEREGIELSGLDDPGIRIEDVVVHDNNALIVRFFNANEIVYRRDLERDDPYGEAEALNRIYGGSVRSVVDLPFAYGTLGVNSSEPGAFGERDIAVLRECAELLSDAFWRLKDLRELALRADRLRQADDLRDAEGELRSRIAAMQQPGDLTRVIGELETQLRRFGVEFDSLSLQVVNPDATDFVCFLAYPHGEYPWQRIVDTVVGVSWVKRSDNMERFPWVGEVWSSGASRYEPCAPEESNMWPGCSLVDVATKYGTLSVNARRSHAFDEGAVRLLERFAATVNGGLERFADLVRQNRNMQEYTALHEVAVAVERMADMEEIDHVMWRIREGLEAIGIDFHGYGINALDLSSDPPSLRVCSTVDAPDAWFEVEDAEVVEAVRRKHLDGQTVYRRDLPAGDPLDGRERLADAENAVRSVVDIPFSHGTMTVSSLRPEAFSGDDIGFMERMAALLAEGFWKRDQFAAIVERNEALQREIVERQRVAGELQRVRDELERRVKERTAELEERNRLLQSLQGLSEAIIASVGMEELLDNLTRYIVQAGMLRSLVVALVDEKNRTISAVREARRYGQGNYSYDVTRPFTYSLDDRDIFADVVRSGRMEVIEGWDQERYTSHGNLPPEHEGRIAYFIPLLQRGQVVAVLATGSQVGEKEEILQRIDLMQPLLNQLTIALEHTRLYESLGRNQSRYEMATQAGAVGVWDWNVATGDVYLDPHLKRLLGYADGEIANRIDDWGRHIHPEDAAGVTAAAEAHLRGETPQYEVERRMVHKDGSVRWFLARGTALRDAEGRAVRMVGTDSDITERRQAAFEREALQQLSGRLAASLHLEEIGASLAEEARRLFAYDALVLALFDEQRAAFDWCYCMDTPEGAAAPRFIPSEPDDQVSLIGRRVLQGERFLIDRAEEPALNPMQAFGATDRVSRSLLFVPLRWEDQSIGLLSVQGYEPGRYEERDLVTLQAFADQCGSAIRNSQLFAEVNETRERLQALSKRLVEVQEEERRQLARELHDEIGQKLTGLSYLIETGRRLPAEEFRARLGEAQAQLSEMMGQVRELSLNLRPALLDDLGLWSTLVWHFERYEVQTGIRVRVDNEVESAPRYAREIEITAFRAVQETLTNVARHAGVDEAEVGLKRVNGWLHLRVEDRGVGFRPQEKIAAPETSGLAGLRERVRLVGGFLDIESQPGQGTRVGISLPLTRGE